MVTLENLVAWDTETYCYPDGYGSITPPLVCASEASFAGREVRSTLHLRPGLGAGDALARFAAIIHDPTVHIAGTNLVFDLSVHAAEDPSLLPAIFAAIDAGRIHSTDIIEALHDNARGCLYRDPITGAPTGAGDGSGRYSQALLELRYLGIDRSAEKTGGDVWRTRYAELDGVPYAAWPQEAVDYPLRDARGALQVAAIQLGLLPDTLLGGGPGPRLNLAQETDEMRAAFALHLSAAYGMRTDAAMVESEVAAMVKEHEESRRRYFEVGIVRVTEAGKDERPDDISREWLEQAAQRIDRASEWGERRVEDIRTALRRLGRGKPIRFATDTKRLKELVDIAYLGEPPRTATGGVSTSRDTLTESDDATLEGFGEAGTGEKMLTFAAVLQRGTRVPINPRTCSMVSSGRTSYSRPNLQQLPRGGGVRACFVPRPGHVFVSVDYSALELATLAQVTYQFFGHSAMREAINAGQDLHARLAARIAGIPFDEAKKLIKAKDKRLANLRQASKPVNFGLPGLMGAAKLVLTARKQGVRFCELAGVSERCGANDRVTSWGKRTISPTCVTCLELAVEYTRLWREEWPEVNEYLALTPRLAELGEPITSLGNGMQRLEDNAGGVSNHFFQNLAAQGAKRSLWKVTREAMTDEASPLYWALRPVVFVHDEIVAEVREDRLHAAAHRLAEVMITTMHDEYTPDVTIRAEPAAARRWFKGMEAVTGRDGLLRPWWPVDAAEPRARSKHPEWSPAQVRAEALKAWTWEPDQATMLEDLGPVGDS